MRTSVKIQEDKRELSSERMQEIKGNEIWSELLKTARFREARILENLIPRFKRPLGQLKFAV